MTSRRNYRQRVDCSLVMKLLLLNFFLILFGLVQVVFERWSIDEMSHSKTISLKNNNTTTNTPTYKGHSDPFFTSSGKRMRNCNSVNVNEIQEFKMPKVKLVFVEELASNIDNTRTEAFKFNLMQSLKRSNYDCSIDYTILTAPYNSSTYDVFLTIWNFMTKERTILTSFHTHIIVSTTLFAVFGSPPLRFVDALDSSKSHLMFSPALDGSGGISVRPFFAIGKVKYMYSLFGYFFSKGNFNIKNKNCQKYAHNLINDIYALKQRAWKLSMDTSGAVIGLATTTNTQHQLCSDQLLASGSNTGQQLADSPFWVVKYEESPQELGGGGLGRSYCLLRRLAPRSRGGCSCPDVNAQPAVVLFPPHTTSALDIKGYNFFTSNYLSAAPISSKFSTSFNRQKLRLVASLTSLPHRLRNIHLTLNSLFSQHVKPNVVYLNIPVSYSRFQHETASASLIAQLLSAFNNKHGVPLVINKVQRDFGPLTKLLPALRTETEPSTIIITVDDDMIYKPTLFGILLQRHMNNPSLAYGVSGQMVDIDGDGSVHVRTAWKWKDGDYAVDILESFTGAIYRRDFFDQELLSNIPAECFFTDDIWISANLAQRRIPRVKLALGWGDTAEFSQNDKVEPLRDNNLNGTKRNDICASFLLEKFKSSWLNGAEEYCSFDYIPL